MTRADTLRDIFELTLTKQRFINGNHPNSQIKAKVKVETKKKIEAKVKNKNF